MDQHSLVEQLSPKVKLVRVEKGYTQERMSMILGVSKKTLVQIEKGRIEASWTTLVAMVALFRDSEVIQHTLGDDPLEVLETIAHDSVTRSKQRTLGGKVWWTTIEEHNSYVIQQNVLSQHYRIIDERHYRYFSSFDLEETRQKLAELGESK
ncbi:MULTISPECIES: helix-turn-helix transcriptional regulator [Pontibacillus]|uniref:Helix-turn-helix domain-containing protein n=1 Tax=Pontibacillus chungwhensis TaxID=265426 RepID=A0ABY8USW9_9BACI|nr:MULTISPECIES: helix-turn-helix domain-containing protein [Pontibacillus]MCD5323032.1 helix-turn-helix domain-containing protein [Pontibacillus sp. HN14]WIF96425.1 helix-turn-helix domain-containing protein [Pontibacillus chungwhensis]